MSKPGVQFCSLLSAAASEPLIGSAGKTDVFLLLEYNSAWEDKAFEKSTLPPAVKQTLVDFAKSLPAAKILLIKRGLQPQSGLFHFFVVITNPQNPRLYRFDLRSYEELLDLSLANVVQGDQEYAGFLQSMQLYLVCTNGRRDLCCARFGLPVYEALKAIAGESAWECSHVGGHRFAPNVLQMPDGLLYGRVQPQEIAKLVSLAQAGQICLENLRGRSAYTPAVQAAEYYLRQQSGERSLTAYRLVDAIETEPGRWRVSFSTAAGNLHRLEILVEQSQEQVFDSCTLDKSTQIISHSLV